MNVSLSLDTSNILENYLSTSPALSTYSNSSDPDKASTSPHMSDHSGVYL